MGDMGDSSSDDVRTLSPNLSPPRMSCFVADFALFPRCFDTHFCVNDSNLGDGGAQYIPNGLGQDGVTHTLNKFNSSISLASLFMRGRNGLG
jgi:hypothetical protein